MKYLGQLVKKCERKRHTKVKTECASSTESYGKRMRVEICSNKKEESVKDSD